MAHVTPTKEGFAQQFQSIVRLHRSGAGGVRVALALTKRLDALIESVYHSLQNPDRTLVAAVALGGYGRKELSFSSDVDIMFLIRDESQKPAAAPVTGDLLHDLLDYGLAIGHSFRTIEECRESAASDLEVWHSLLESRLICGNKAVFSDFRKQLQQEVHEVDVPTYVNNLLVATELRHRKYGHSAKLLEPNLKNSAGGLRDLHTVFWLSRGAGLTAIPRLMHAQETALTNMLRGAFLHKHFGNSFLVGVRRGLDFILRTRNEMHLHANALHDTLEFNLQRTVSASLGFRDSKKNTDVEQFMRQYYVSTRAVSQLAQRVMNWAHDHYLTESGPRTIQKLEAPFVIKNKKIDLGRRVAKPTSEQALRAFILSIDHSLPFSHVLEDVLVRNAGHFGPLRSKRETALFRDLLNKPRGVGPAMQQMNALGLLSQWIPEWKGLVAFFQHNQYHYYTADEHTLMVLSSVEALASNPNALGRIFRELPRRDTLYLAALFHDIAKPIRIGDHEIIGVDVSRAILKRLRYDDVIDDVLFLVRHHLFMEQVAFRRNLGDPQTILDFTSKISNARQLEYLYLLTFADLSAVNKNVWTDWKATLLEALFESAHRILKNSLSYEAYVLAEAGRHETAVQEIVTELTTSVPEGEARDHLGAIDSRSYLATFDAAEIAEHIRRIGTDETVSTIFKRKEDHTEVTIIALDAPFALSRCCGVLSANDANILDAQIFTRSDGMIIDRFRVVDYLTKASLSVTQCDKIHRELNQVFEETVDIEHLLQRHRMRWKRRRKIPNPNIRTDVEFENHPRYTIIDVYAPDMLGFLYRITGTMSMLGLNISFAKIATRVDGIVDSFYILDLHGRKVDEEGRRNYVRDEILKVIDDLTETELVTQ